jgi:predicted metallopeptidase
MRNRVLSFDQEDFLLKCVKLIESEFSADSLAAVWGTQMIYQWDLQKEKRFIYRVLSDREYDLFEDADKLNSLRNLYGYLKKGVATSN